MTAKLQRPHVEHLLRQEPSPVRDLARTRISALFWVGNVVSNMQFELGSGPMRIAIAKRIR